MGLQKLRLKSVFFEILDALIIFGLPKLLIDMVALSIGISQIFVKAL
jgi:hypothetical protein